MSKSKKGRKSLWKMIKKHKAASAVIALFLICILTVGGIVGALAWEHAI